MCDTSAHLDGFKAYCMSDNENIFPEVRDLFPRKKRLLIVGHKNHGKDTVAEMMQDIYGFTFESSSVAAARIFLYEKLKVKYGYGSFMECFKDRDNHRPEWYNEIENYNREDKARLAKDILATSNIYVGMRSEIEIDECLRQNLFDLIIGIYDPRKPLEDERSFKINLWQKAHIVIPNAEGLKELQYRIHELKPLLFK